MKIRKKTRRPALVPILLLSTVAVIAVACGGDEPQQPPGGAQTPPGASGASSAQPAAAAPGAPAPGAADAGVPDAMANLPPLPLREFQESDFSESEQSRDPFRSFETLFVVQPTASKAVVQRKVLVDHYALQELKLVGIVTRAQPRALLTDPNGYGYVAKVGDFVGKAERVNGGGPQAIDVDVNWRVDRIRDGDVVFVREDPSHPEIPPATLVIALRTPEEAAAMKNSGRPQ